VLRDGDPAARTPPRTTTLAFDGDVALLAVRHAPGGGDPLLGLFKVRRFLLDLP
jgi:hypothetical protein